jgi:hypothetical protein
MLLTFQTHPLNAVALSLHSLLELSFHLMHQIIIEVYLLLNLLYSNGLKEVSHGSLFLVPVLPLSEFNLCEILIHHFIKHFLRMIRVIFFIF